MEQLHFFCCAVFQGFFSFFGGFLDFLLLGLYFFCLLFYHIFEFFLIFFGLLWVSYLCGHRKGIVKGSETPGS